MGGGAADAAGGNDDDPILDDALETPDPSLEDEELPEEELTPEQQAEAEAIEDEALEAGFASESIGQESPPTEVPQDPGQPEQQRPAAPDPSAGQPPREGQPEPQPAKDAGFEKRVRALEGHVGNLTRRNRELEALLKQQAGASQPGAPATGTPPSAAAVGKVVDQLKGADEFRAIEREFPEFTKLVTRAVETVMSAAPQGGAVDVAELRKQIKTEMSISQLEARHADYRDLLANNAVEEWVQGQSAKIQRKWRSEWGSDVADVLDEYLEAGTESAPTTTAAPTAPASRPTTGSRLARALPATTGRAAAPPTRVMTEDEAMEEGFKRG